MDKAGQLDRKYIKRLDYIREGITYDYTRARITKEQYEKLIEEVSTKYREVFNNELNCLNNLPIKEKKEKLVQLKHIIEDSFAIGKINDKQYNLFKEKILEQYRE